MRAYRVGWRHEGPRVHTSAPGLVLLGAFLLGMFVGMAWQDMAAPGVPDAPEPLLVVPPTLTPPLETRLDRFEFVSARV